jgi:hypothetical protein
MTDGEKAIEIINVILIPLWVYCTIGGFRAWPALDKIKNLESKIELLNLIHKKELAEKLSEIQAAKELLKAAGEKTDGQG